MEFAALVFAFCSPHIPGILTTDFSSAFSSVCRKWIRTGLVTSGFPKATVRALMRFMHKATASVKVGQKRGPLISLDSGVFQGDPAAADLFTLAID